MFILTTVYELDLINLGEQENFIFLVEIRVDR